MEFVDHAPPAAPSLEQQRDALQKGQGRAVQWAMNGRLNPEPLLEACLHDQRHDSQIDAPARRLALEHGPDGRRRGAIPCADPPCVVRTCRRVAAPSSYANSPDITPRRETMPSVHGYTKLSSEGHSPVIVRVSEKRKSSSWTASQLSCLPRECEARSWLSLESATTGASWTLRLNALAKGASANFWMPPRMWRSVDFETVGGATNFTAPSKAGAGRPRSAWRRFPLRRSFEKPQGRASAIGSRSGENTPTKPICG